MLFMDSRTISETLTYPTLIEALEHAHRGQKLRAEDVMMHVGNNHYYTRHAVDPGRYFASKLITSFPTNREKDEFPTVQAVCVLFDGSNGKPLAVLDGTEITYWRTSADSALGSRLLSRENAEILLVVGAGAMSHWLIRAHVSVRPSLRQVLIWNRSAGRAEELSKEVSRTGIEAISVADLETATSQAHIITCCTASKEPLIKGRNLRPGTHLDLVGGFSDDTREADDEAARRSLVFVDSRESAFHGVGDILGPIRSGAILQSDVLGDLYDLVGGRVAGRKSPDDITFFKNAGGGHLDLITCEAVYRLVKHKHGPAPALM